MAGIYFLYNGDIWLTVLNMETVISIKSFSTVKVVQFYSVTFFRLD